MELRQNTLASLLSDLAYQHKTRAHDPPTLFLRSDLHTLFDLGYVTVDPDRLCTVISSRIREEFENGRDYYRFHGQPVTLPKDTNAMPAREFLGLPCRCQIPIATV